jgi:hypothetical protein
VSPVFDLLDHLYPYVADLVREDSLVNSGCIQQKEVGRRSGRRGYLMHVRSTVPWELFWHGIQKQQRSRRYAVRFKIELK